MARKFGRKNEIKLDPLKYNLCLIGEGGIGKTTLIKQYCERLAGEDGYMFLDVGKEDGSDAINGIVAEPVWDWENLMTSLLILSKTAIQIIKTSKSSL